MNRLIGAMLDDARKRPRPLCQCPGLARGIGTWHAGPAPRTGTLAACRCPAAAARFPADRRAASCCAATQPLNRRCGTASNGWSTTCCFRCCCSTRSCEARCSRRDARAWRWRAWPCVACGIAAGLRAAAAGPGVDAQLHASGAQTAFRFNSYVALALAERLAGPQGLAWMALLIAVCVPLCNVAAVWPLARHGGHGYLRELVRNPLIIEHRRRPASPTWRACSLPDAVATALQRIGAGRAAAGPDGGGRRACKFGGLQAAPGLAAALAGASAMRCCRCWRIGLVSALALPAAQQAVVVAFAALPTAPSAYVLAVRMGGHGAFVAGLVTVSTLLCAIACRLAGGAGVAAAASCRAPAAAALRQRPVDVLAQQRAGAGERARAAPARSPRRRGAAARCPAPPPGCAASARGRCGGSRCLRCGAGTRPRSRPTARSSVAPSSGARASKSGSGAALRVLVPRADELAVVAAVDAVADQRRAARPGSARRARSSGRRCSAARRAGTARRWPASGRRRCRRCSCRSAPSTGARERQREVDEDLAEEEHRAGLALQRQRVLAAPAEAAARGQLDLQHRRRIGEHAVAERADRAPRCGRPASAAARAAPCDSRGRGRRATRCACVGLAAGAATRSPASPRRVARGR